MAKGPNYVVPFRRRREGKTNYRRRLKLLFSKKPRLVIRRSNKNINLQLIVTGDKGDMTLISASSSDLGKYGYNGGTGNTPAAYLTGLLFGKKAVSNGYKQAILDIGLQSTTRGSRIYGALKGTIDGGMEVPFNEEVLPNEDRIKGAHVQNFDDLPAHVESVKNNILQNFEV